MKSAGQIVVLGDIEGQGARFDEFIEVSGAFQGRGAALELRAGYRFVFIGDSIDRGSAAMRILDTLVRLKEQYPQRVVLLMGNRDINKLYFVREFASEVAAGLPEQPADPLSAEKLKRLLQHRNSPHAFEYRRQELLKADPGKPRASDHEVLRSMIADVLPGGRLHRYLKLAQVAYVDEPTGGFFVHGGLSVRSIGRVPGERRIYRDLRAWVERLNSWAHALPPALLDYQRPLPRTPRRNDRSVIYGRFSDDSGNPRLPARAVRQYLAANGIRYVAAGHTPYGDLPVVLSAGDAPDLKIILMDNSYSSHQRASIVRISEAELHTTGITAEGLRVRATVPIVGPTRLGRPTPDGWRVIGQLDSGDFVLWQVADHFESRYKVTSPQDLVLAPAPHW